ncbi:carboxypeptidase-like regulatory domain-containing protein [Priestia megaterium]
MVQVLDANDTIIGTAGTDNNGNYSIGNLPPGSFTTVVNAPNFGSQISGVTLEPGDVITGVNFSLVPNPGGISGLITNETNGEPLTNVTIVIRQSIGSGIAIATVTTDSSGNFLVQGLSPGSYTVTALSPGFGTETVGALVTSDSTSTANIALNELSGSIRGNSLILTEIQLPDRTYKFGFSIKMACSYSQILLNLMVHLYSRIFPW